MFMVSFVKISNGFLPPNNLDNQLCTPMQKLELTWIGKGNEPKLEPRILLHDPEHSIGTHAGNATDNMLIHGDNLLALKALEQDFSGKVKCIYIDPPFNTGQAFEHYDDGIEHSLWLSLMFNRLKLLHRLLSEEGCIFVHIDETELGYCQVMLDEIFHRSNRVAFCTFKQSSATGHKAINPGPVNVANYVFIYAKNKSKWQWNRVYAPRERDDRYGQYILNRHENHESWRFGLLTSVFEKEVIAKSTRKFTEKQKEQALHQFVLENADRVVQSASPNYEGVSQEARNMIDISKQNPDKIFLLQREKDPDMYFLNGKRLLFYSGKVQNIDGRLCTAEPITTIWTDLLSNNLHNEGSISFPKGKKPEAFIKRILEIATQPGDLVLDSFLGSGTTAAVAHKMGRRWIGIELGQHAYTHCYERLRKVVRGEDAGGITEATGWNGGGGFRFYTLAPSLLRKDEYGQWVIDERYNAAMLAAAMAKQEGFRYDPHETAYWKQGRSTEKDFIYTTTQFITVEALERLRGEMKDDESLLVCCRSYASACKGKHPNITIKKIPLMLLGRCEFGKDDYSLNVETAIVNLPPGDNDEDLPDASTEASSTPPVQKKRGGKKATMGTEEQTLFE